MDSIVMRPPSLSDVRELSWSMRLDDFLELSAATGQEPLDEIQYGVDVSEECWSDF